MKKLKKLMLDIMTHLGSKKVAVKIKAWEVASINHNNLILVNYHHFLKGNHRLLKKKINNQYKLNHNL
jgi:hypothetical protein